MFKEPFIAQKLKFSEIIPIIPNWFCRVSLLTQNLILQLLLIFFQTGYVKEILFPGHVG